MEFMSIIFQCIQKKVDVAKFEDMLIRGGIEHVHGVASLPREYIAAEGFVSGAIRTVHSAMVDSVSPLSAILHGGNLQGTVFGIMFHDLSLSSANFLSAVKSVLIIRTLIAASGITVVFLCTCEAASRRIIRVVRAAVGLKIIPRIGAVGTGSVDLTGVGVRHSRGTC